MKKKELFEGAIVLARRCKGEKRRRCKVVSLVSGQLIVVEFQYGLRTLVSADDIQPAKITRKSLKECGFEDPIFKNCKGKCYIYTGTRVHLLLKDSACGNKTGNVLQVPWKHKQVRYMHEVQREVAKLKIKDYLK